jgi:hypothetical protein
MLRLINLYCSGCLRTRRFLDLGTHLICEVCSKRLERVVPRTDANSPDDSRVTRRHAG